MAKLLTRRKSSQIAADVYGAIQSGCSGSKPAANGTGARGYSASRQPGIGWLADA